MRPLSGAKRLEHGRTTFSEIYKVEMRVREVNVDGECQVIYGGEIFQIVSIEISGKVNIVIAR